MMFGALLTTHIIGAIATLAVVLYALVVLLKTDAPRYRAIVYALSSLAAFELVTGALLAALSHQVTVASMCDNIVLYLALVGATEVAIYFRMKDRAQFPLVHTLSSVGPGIGLLLIGVFLGI